jgi:hypothetical protein
MSEIVHQEDYCLNCKTTLQGNFCHRCGQKKLDTHNDSILHMMTHFIGDFVHFDSQIFRTAIPLLFKPGFLVNEYLKGKRVRYLSPVRMYVFLSFLFFFLTFSFTDFTKKSEQKAKEGSVLNFSIKDDSSGSSRNMSWTELSDTLVKFDEGDVTFGKEKYISAQQYDSLQKTFSREKQDGWLVHQLKIKGLIFKEKITGQERGVFFNEMIYNFIHHFPKVLFFLLPFFALLLKILYRKRYYTEHLIFSIQFYNFFFLFGSIFLLVRLIPFFQNSGGALYELLPLMYLFFSLKNVYQQSKTKTVMKFGIFILTFSLLLVFGIFVNILLTIFST